MTYQKWKKKKFIKSSELYTLYREMCLKKEKNTLKWSQETFFVKIHALNMTRIAGRLYWYFPTQRKKILFIISWNKKRSKKKRDTCWEKKRNLTWVNFLDCFQTRRVIFMKKTIKELFEIFPRSKFNLTVKQLNKVWTK